MTREEVVQAALTVERWCVLTECNKCPFWDFVDDDCRISRGKIHAPMDWELEKFFRTRGLKHDD